MIRIIESMGELFLMIILLVIYFIGFFAGKGWERSKWEERISEEPKPKKARR